ncbi:hypothetical protein PIB30_031930 [Stylosanthes scabra]|uniref:Uncharacterized protein n=1 Tax=Stylosanthes scabra TaxID=79078 RepID=A0ABU6ZC20_9FABA|nr:hypothetical protein [Stylosanthes scabra]
MSRMETKALQTLTTPDGPLLPKCESIPKKSSTPCPQTNRFAPDWSRLKTLSKSFVFSNFPQSRLEPKTNRFKAQTLGFVQERIGSVMNRIGSLAIKFKDFEEFRPRESTRCPLN